MGKGVPAIENKEKYHGQALPKEYARALKVLGSGTTRALERRSMRPAGHGSRRSTISPDAGPSR